MYQKVAIAGIAIIVVVVAALFLQQDDTDIDIQEKVEEDSKKLLVLATFYPVEQFARAVGGDLAKVKPVLPPGFEPHHWEPTIKDVQFMSSADVMVTNGIGYEAWLDTDNFDFMVIDTSDGVQLLEIAAGTGDHRAVHEDEHAHHHGQYDPHIWLSPKNAIIQVKNIAVGLSKADPDNADAYIANAIAYTEKLEKLDADFEQRLEGCNTEIITFHQAFEYMADAYGLQQYVILKSTSPHGEVSVNDLRDAIDVAKSHGITVIFGEEATNPRAVELVASELEGGRVFELSPLENVQDDATYLEKMYTNLDVLELALC